MVECLGVGSMDTSNYLLYSVKMFFVFLVKLTEDAFLVFQFLKYIVFDFAWWQENDQYSELNKTRL